MHPLAGGLGGGTLLAVSGSGFGGGGGGGGAGLGTTASAARCRIGDASVPARRARRRACSRARRRARARLGTLLSRWRADGHEFTSGGAHFEYQRAHRVRALAPSSGRRRAVRSSASLGTASRGALPCSGTSRAASTGALRRRAWRGAAEVRCIAPAHAAGVVGVELTQNAQQHTGDGARSSSTRARSRTACARALARRAAARSSRCAARALARAAAARARCTASLARVRRCARLARVVCSCAASRRPPPRSAGRCRCACSTATRCVAARRRSCTAVAGAVHRVHPRGRTRRRHAPRRLWLGLWRRRRRRWSRPRHDGVGGTVPHRRRVGAGAARGGGRARVRDAARAHAWVRCCRGGGRWARVHVGRCAL